MMRLQLMETPCFMDIHAQSGGFGASTTLDFR